MGGSSWGGGYGPAPGLGGRGADDAHQPHKLHIGPGEVSLLLAPLVSAVQPAFGAALVPLLVVRREQGRPVDCEDVPRLQGNVVPALTLVFKECPVLKAVGSHNHVLSQTQTDTTHTHTLAPFPDVFSKTDKRALPKKTLIHT